MGEDLRFAIGKDQRQFVRKPFPVMQNVCAIRFLFFPMIGELHRAPMRDMAIFSFAEDSVEHSRRTEQSDVSAVQGRKRPASDILLLR